jgi:hypothetical protein
MEKPHREVTAGVRLGVEQSDHPASLVSALNNGMYVCGALVDVVDKLANEERHGWDNGMIEGLKTHHTTRTLIYVLY